MRTIDRHHCDKQHRNPRTFMHCAIPSAKSVRGDGALALILWCDQPRIVLFRHLTWARTVEAEYRVFGCSPLCAGDHELAVVHLYNALERDIA